MEDLNRRAQPAPAPTSGSEWGGDGEPPAEIEADPKGWPILHPSEPCEGENPMTGLACAIRFHKGYHRDASGAEWLDED